MKQRALSLVLALVFVLCLFPVSASAAQDLRASSSCVSLIKQFEGFSRYPYWDFGQYTVGYGTRCPAADLERYRTYGITEAEALALLDREVGVFAGYVNNFANANGLAFSQTQFDALVSFTYNVGPGWMSQTDSILTRAVLSGAEGNDFLFAMTLWSTAGGQVLTPLVERRMIEANLYLNGEYASAVPDNYCYVLFDHITSLYEGESQTIRIQGYDASRADEVRPVAAGSGNRFLGWYDAASGGEWVTHLDASHDGKTLYARWQSGSGPVTGGVIQGTAASYSRSADSALTVRAWPASDATARYTIAAGDAVAVVADYVDGSGNKWGRLADGGWVALEHTSPMLTDFEDPAGIFVTVTGSRVNVRSGPGTGYGWLGSVYCGQRLVITDVQEAGGMTWGRFDGGWICLDYTDYQPAEPVIATGTVTGVETSVNVRSGPGTYYQLVGQLPLGTHLELLEISGSWCRIAQGWIYTAYVTLDTEEPTEPPTEEPTEPPTEEPTEPPVEEEPVGEPVIASGVVTTATVPLKIRQGAGTWYPQVGQLPRGTRVEIYEYTMVGDVQWGRIEDGWICMTYVTLDAAEEPEVPEEPTVPEEPVIPEEPVVPEAPETPAVPVGRGGTVNVSGTVNVRSGPGTGYDRVCSLTDGTRVTVTEMQMAGYMLWGKIEEGWICLDYVELDEPAAGSPAMVDAYNVNLREGPGTNYSKVGTLTKGDMITILETEQVGSYTWGRTEQGWIRLDFVL